MASTNNNGRLYVRIQNYGRKKKFLEIFNFHNNKIANISVSTSVSEIHQGFSFEIFIIILRFF